MPEPVHAIRQFNRFYTRRIGVLQEGLLDSDFSLTEARVFYELATRDRTTAAELGAELALDAGYLSRILTSFGRRGLLRKQRSQEDGRQSLLSLTAKGKAAFQSLNAQSNRDVAAMIDSLSNTQRKALVDAMQTIQAVLAPAESRREPYVLRPHQPGDLGWVVHRHGVIYAREYGFNEEFEALVAEIVAKFAREFDPKYDRCWISERDGDILGFIFLVKEDSKSKGAPKVAKLRLFLVEASARGQGVGRRLVQECVRFARQAGYRKIKLWTQDDLYAARHLYKEAGFRLTHSEKHHSFGKNLVAETWELNLDKTP